MPKKQKPRTRVNSPAKVGYFSQSLSKKMMLWPRRGMKETKKMSFFLSNIVSTLLLMPDVITA